MPLYSLKNQKQFDLVNSRGKKITTPYFMVVLARNFTSIESISDNPTFFGMKVSRKISKKACIRNKIKRRVRHLMRIMLADSELNLSQTALVVIPYKKFELFEFAKISSELKRVLKR